MSISVDLSRAQKLTCQAAAMLVIQIVRRRFSKAATGAALSKSEEAVKIMQRLISTSETGG